ncbi:FeoB small GTPase domain-containing protein, partial [Adlercreutzia sp. DFI.6.23]|uniref:FeoB small GTPase domain-containing protein n=1 Tax=Adlercreutzia sp. DFI.6.23 TaxID=2963705 RepID=UPI00210EE9E1
MREMGIPTVVALNMMDLVEKNGDKIDVDALAKRLGCPVVPTSEGVGEFTQANADCERIVLTESHACGAA